MRFLQNYRDNMDIIMKPIALHLRPRLGRRSAVNGTKDIVAQASRTEFGKVLGVVGKQRLFSCGPNFANCWGGAMFQMERPGHSTECVTGSRTAGR